jgi:hypothetical protein
VNVTLTTAQANITLYQNDIVTITQTIKDMELVLTKMQLEGESRQKQFDAYMEELAIIDADIDTKKNVSATLNEQIDNLVHIGNLRQSELKQVLKYIKKQFRCADNTLVYDTANCLEGPNNQEIAMNSVIRDANKAFAEDKKTMEGLQEKIDASDKAIQTIIDTSRKGIMDLIDGLHSGEKKIELLQFSSKLDEARNNLTVANIVLVQYQNETDTEIQKLNDEIASIIQNVADIEAQGGSIEAGLRADIFSAQIGKFCPL